LLRGELDLLSETSSVLPFLSHLSNQAQVGRVQAPIPAVVVAATVVMMLSADD
jgi:hypothetical protein